MILFLIGAFGLKAVSSQYLQMLDLEEGDYCKPLDGELGTCVLLTKCETIEDFKTNQPPICGFPDNSIIPIVCCPTKPTPSIKTGDKAEKVCMELNTKCIKNLLLTPNVMNGIESQPRKHPYTVLIGYGQNKIEWGCGGSLITKRYVLSAAHCSFLGTSGPAKWARLGELDYSSSLDDAKPVDKIIIKRIPHPHFSARSFSHDIALFKLDSDVVFNEYISPICLNTKLQITSSRATAMGWGRIGPNEATSERLREVEIDIYNDTECKRLMLNGSPTDDQICAGVPIEGKDTCQGDSGGPLVVLDVGMCVEAQIGITSFGYSCGISPGVYTRVSNYISWIEDVAFSG